MNAHFVIGLSVGVLGLLVRGLPKSAVMFW